MKRLFLLFSILLVARAGASAQTTMIPWSAFSGGYGELSSAGTIQRGMAGEPTSGASADGNGSVESGFLLGSEVLGGNSATVSLTGGWNMLSLPRRPVLPLKDELYPGAESFAFAFEAMYLPKDTMRVGVGYWLKYPAAAQVAIAGELVLAESVAVSGGWNLIGAISAPVAAVSLTSDPPGLVTSEFFGFTTLYEGADTLLPGKAYWVKVASAGTLVLAYAAGAFPKNRIAIVPTAEMPPPAPGGAEADPRSAAAGVPLAYSLGQNYPNPFNPATVLRFATPAAGHVALRVYNILGEEVAVLVDEARPAGYHTFRFDASRLPSGMYFYRIRAGEFTGVRKMLYLK